MKHFYTILLITFSIYLAKAQIVNIPDPNFKSALINTNCIDLNNDGVGDIDVDANNDGEIQESEVANIIHLYLIDRSINSLEGLSYFTSLERLWCPQNNITTVDLSQNSALRIINCESNQLEALDLVNNPMMIYLKCNNNQITDIDLSQNGLLQELYISDNLITQLDISHNPNISHLTIQDSFVNAIFMKNGGNLNGGSFFIENCSNLQFICVDDSEMEAIQSRIDFYGYTNCVVNSYCTFEPGGGFFTINGAVKLDLDSNGCDTGDLVFPNLKFNISSGSDTAYFVPNASGNYQMTFGDGMFTITPQFENSSYYNVSPESIALDFPVDGSLISQDFCITPNGVLNDLEIIIIPVSQARPGFQSKYKLVYKNKGNVAQSGTVSFYFSDNIEVSNYENAFPTEASIAEGVVTWNYTDLQPFETRDIDIVLNLNTPTDSENPLNGGDVLSYNAQIFPVVDDVTPSDNGSSVRQLVVNSLDPNDKTCLEGQAITPERVGEFVHYMIRFENTGTANAINVVVKDIIDTSKFDINTLIPLHASHNFVTRIQNTNDVEFIFENINLPFDDATNDGYVVFKIKTLGTLILGDEFSNDAEIYFDFNAPIITNDYITSVDDNLSLNEVFLDANIKLYPNPVSDVLHVSSEETINSISIYDINGRLLKTVAFVGNEIEGSVKVEQLSEGVYFLSLKTNKGNMVEKFIKN